MREGYKPLVTGYALGVQAIPSLFAATLSVACVSIAAAFALDLDKVGLLFLAGNGGAFLSFLLGGYLCDRIGRGRVLLWGGGICVVGSTLCATAPSLVVLVFGAFMIGVGGGSLALAGIALLNDLHQERRRMVITSSQLVASSASFLGPIAVGHLIQSKGSWRIPYEILSLLLIVLLLPLLAFRFPTTTHGRSSVNGIFGWFSFRSCRFSLLSAGYLLHAGAEIGISSWICMYLARRFELDPLLTGLGLTLYSLGMILGRAVLSKLPERYADTDVLKVCVMGAAVFVFLALLSPNYRVSLVLFALVGIFISGDSPVMLTYAGRHFPERSGTAFGHLLMSGSIGGFIFPPLMGLIARHMGIVMVMVSPLILLAALFVVVVVLDRMGSKEPLPYDMVKTSS